MSSSEIPMVIETSQPWVSQALLRIACSAPLHTHVVRPTTGARATTPALRSRGAKTALRRPDFACCAADGLGEKSGRLCRENGRPKTRHRLPCLPAILLALSTSPLVGAARPSADLRSARKNQKRSDEKPRPPGSRAQTKHRTAPETP